MRTVWIVSLVALAACAGDEPADTTGVDDTNDIVDDSHPLVPDEFKFVWNTDGECSNEWGSGDQMYMIFEGRVDAAGNFSGTEQVWWFFADEPDENDCVDTFELTGTALVGDPASLGCSSCEEFYRVTRTLTTDNCNSRQYNRVYREDDSGGLYQVLMIDTKNEFNDQPNENDKIGVFHESWNILRKEYETSLYAADDGSLIVPSGEEFGPPADYKWIGNRCHAAAPDPCAGPRSPPGRSSGRR